MDAKRARGLCGSWASLDEDTALIRDAAALTALSRRRGRVEAAAEE
ncbi:hypothetical protein KEG57_27795 [Polyangium jinanense]|uniref:Uncharacterized protein n=1 Tax=Polyangium jinanense TaxID=2829994 RepID=A0A9X3X4W0_9BACT|nr:hypothetical protein [Polyangium jinanense]MDC3984341.1 hypothetical protein [Polyangium jinanense]